MAINFLKKVKENLLGTSTKQNEKYVAGMDKSRNQFSNKLNELAARYRELDEDYFEELENILIMSDVGVNMVMEIVDEIKKEVRIQNIKSPNEIYEIIVDKMFVIYANQGFMTNQINYASQGLTVIFIVGVNGVGKTTSIAKLANHIMKNENKTVMVAAGDTFRAGAVDQIIEWSNRLGIKCVYNKETNDPSAIIFEAIQKAQQENVDVLICDTAGRLQNKVNLMNELDKMKRTIQKLVPEGPHETLLVLDATTGQNGVNQARSFVEVTNIDGIILTKMDGSAKGGIVLAIKEQLDIPVKFIGLGEKVEDLAEFDLESYIYGLCKDILN